MIRMDKTFCSWNIFFNGIKAFLQLCRGHPSTFQWKSAQVVRTTLCGELLENTKPWNDPKKVSLGRRKDVQQVWWFFKHLQ